ncbi:hypothetical protein BAE44_0017332 [Dichanthelium oligosanthes]|uniref:Uncharacterized protein n=1 Tax=Dichanthelium oligosanthes TaxID=888268 RepID=A0A1E5V9B8_9POAL|nr:hypothetical protein BAE44_0017332 [Dichanthelium oligosanthes]
MALAPLSDLPFGRAQCAVCVRVVRLWDYCRNKEDQPPLHVDMVVVDEKDSSVVAIFVGLLLKSYKNKNTLSGGSACKWYINEDIPEIENFFRQNDLKRYFSCAGCTKIEWISAGEQQFRALEQPKNLEEKTVLQIRNMDPWEFEGSRYHGGSHLAQSALELQFLMAANTSALEDVRALPPNQSTASALSYTSMQSLFFFCRSCLIHQPC